MPSPVVACTDTGPRARTEGQGHDTGAAEQTYPGTVTRVASVLFTLYSLNVRGAHRQ